MTKELLMHWWHYYGKAIYTFEDLEKFLSLIDKYGAEKISELVVASYISNDGSPTVLLFAIRHNQAENLLNTLPDVSAFSKKEKELYDVLKNSLEKEIETSYNNLSVAATINEKIGVIIRSAIIFNKRHRRRISFENIVKVRFRSCTFYFDVRALQKHERDIVYIFDNVKTGQGSLYRLFRLKDDFIWTEDLGPIHDLMLIGLATGHIKYVKNHFKNVRNPYIICN